MKNIFKKNQVIITALAIMIVVAGYLQFTEDKVGNKKDNMDSYVAADQNIDMDKDALTTSADVASNNESLESDQMLTVNNEESLSSETASIDESALDISEEDIFVGDVGGIDVSDKGELVTNKAEDEVIGEAVLVNKTIKSSFFASAKLKREQTRAKNKTLLMELIGKTDISEDQKQEAVSKMISITAISEKENAAETLLEAKGFDGSVVTIIADDIETVDVVVNSANITDQEIAIIEDIIKKKTGITVEHITITPVKAE